ncbi:MinD/ParA family ATP-binding protein [Actinopolyspora mortivallis]|uniref:ATPase n=1 Tax=Actinopolyspora mortivallis TaxID=33906 RepID=A0A2T0GXQ1_ACTMO|nr:MinD/ParA family protein [Actinopolyspora mortivallis]PRW63874.1 ATPase [Actinopolyspora mortivallis]
MTGGQDEPGVRHDPQRDPIGATPEPNTESTEAAEHAAPDYGTAQAQGWPGSARPVPPEQSAPTPTGEAAPWGGHPGTWPPQANPQSGPYPVASPPQGNPVVSGPQQVPPGASGPYGVGGNPSGPYPAPAGQQPYPAPGYPPPPQPHPGQQPVPPQQDPTGQDLSSAQLLRQSKRPPQSGWRRVLYLASGKTINPGESPADVHRRELIGRINQPLQGCYKIAMLSLKGGVGKTTTTATLGSTFASLRGDRIIAVDANPDRGTLGQKIPVETTATVRHLLRDVQRIRKYSDVRSYTSQGPSRLEVLASEQDPAVSEAFSESDYRTTVDLLEHFYNVVLTDCGTGLMHSAMKGVLDVADSLVIVSPSSVDGARSASATLDWLDAHGYGELVARSVAVINSVRPGSGKVDVDKLAAHFGARCRSVSRIPFDSHLEEGAEVDLDQLAAPTRLALLELAATVADDFPYAAGRQHQG